MRGSRQGSDGECPVLAKPRQRVGMGSHPPLAATRALDDVTVLKRRLTEGLPPSERRKLEKFLNRLSRKKGGRK